MQNIALVVIILFFFFICQYNKKENFAKIERCKCKKSNLCSDKIIKNGLCFEDKDKCEKVCSQIYDKVGIKRKVIHKCKRDTDNTFICKTPDWLDRYIR
jgi:hypothetical protein